METILKMIDEVDPKDTAKLDEIENTDELRSLSFLGFDGYSISPNGDVVSYKRNNAPFKMAIGKNYKGYKTVNLQHETGDSHRKTIHRLVALAYIPNPDNKPFVCHRDGDNQNNWYENLYWGTHSENMDDLIRHGTLKGEGNARAVLTKEQVDALRIVYALIPRGARDKFANMFNLSPSTIKRAISGETWKS